MPLNYYDNLFTILLVGGDWRLRIGKSSIINRYVQDIFTEDYINPGLSQDFRVKRVEIPGATIKLAISEYSPQLNYNNTIWQKHVIMICYDVTNRISFNKVRDCFRSYMANRAPHEEALKILVGTKIDLTIKRVITPEEAKQLADEYGMDYREVSAKSREGINELFESVALVRLLERFYNPFVMNEDCLNILRLNTVNYMLTHATKSSLRHANDPTLTSLNLSWNQLGVGEAEVLAVTLAANPPLLRLSLTNNQLGDAGVKVLAAALKANHTLTTLYLSNNQLGDAGAKALAEALTENYTLTALNLWSNQIGDAGAQALAAALTANNTLTILDLHNNQIGDMGAQALADALKVNHILTELYLQNNRIYETGGGKALVNAFKVNHTLTTLSMNGKIADDSTKCYRLNRNHQPHLPDIIKITAQATTIFTSVQLVKHLLSATQPSSYLYQTFGYTAWHIVALAGNPVLIEALAKTDTPIDIKDKQGFTSMQLAEQQGCSALIKAFKKAKELQEFNNLLLEAPQSQQGFANRHLVLQAELHRLQEKSALPAYIDLTRQTWATIFQLQTREAEFIKAELFNLLNSLRLPASFLCYTANWVADISVGLLKEHHPIFKELVKQLKILQKVQANIQLTASTQALLAQLMTLYQQYMTTVYTVFAVERQQWYQQPILMIGPGLTASFLTESARQLAQSQTKAKGEYGTTPICQLGNIHFKPHPHAPGIEFMLSSLGSIIADEGAAIPTELIKIIAPDGIGYVYQASKTIHGKKLQKVIEYRPDALTKLRLSNFSAMILLGLLTNPQDGKPDNYLVEFTVDKEDNLANVNILSINHDIAFVDAVVLCHKAGEKQGQYFVNIKNVLYFLPFMQQPIEKSIRNNLLNQVPEILLLQWLKLLLDKNKEYNALLQNGLFTAEEFKGDRTSKRGLQLPMKMVPGTLPKLYHKLLNLFTLLSSDPQFTHQQLFEVLEPEMAKHYQWVADRHCKAPGEIDVMAAIQDLYEESISDEQELKAYRAQLSTGDTNILSQTVLKTVAEFDFEEGRTQAIQDSLLEFLQAIDYSHFSGDKALIFHHSLQQHADLLFRDKKTMLHAAIENKLHRLAEFLLINQFNEVNIANDSGHTAAHIAASLGDITLLEVLQHHGADLTATDKLGQTVLNKAKDRNQLDTIRWLEREMNKTATPTIAANFPTSITQPSTFFTATEGSIDQAASSTLLPKPPTNHFL